MKRWSIPHYVLLVAVLALLFANSAFAQFQTGNIYGKVQGKDGAVLPGVTVTLTGVGAPQNRLRIRRRQGDTEKGRQGEVPAERSCFPSPSGRGSG